MLSIVRTFTTRSENHPALSARAALESRVERKLYAALRTGRKFTGDLGTNFYQQFGISAMTLNIIHRQLQGSSRQYRNWLRRMSPALRSELRRSRNASQRSREPLRTGAIRLEGSPFPDLRRTALSSRAQHVRMHSSAFCITTIADWYPFNIGWPLQSDRSQTRESAMAHASVSTLSTISRPMALTITRTG